MPSTQVPGLTVNAAGEHIIDKEYRGVRIFGRLGAIAEEDAARQVRVEMDRVDQELHDRAHRRPRFKDCAARYLARCERKITKDNSGLHVRLLLPYIGDLEPKCVHEGTLRSFVEDRLAAGRDSNHGQSEPRGGANDPEPSRARLSR